ncbi:MAG TPA: hypothetical protein VH880_13205 [Anaeromyxobacteraceae bacterium]|jgi:hypothetical protein
MAAVAVLLAAAGAARAGPLEDALARADAAWPERDQPGKLEAIRTALDEAEGAAPGDPGVAWRRARLLFWISDDLAIAREEKSRLGKDCWEIADRVAAARPADVRGWFYGAVCIGNYSLGMGILRALMQGLEPKFKERLAKAEAIDPAFDGGAVFVSWGRFWYELPWPKYDAEASERALRRSLRFNPMNQRSRVYLAELFLKEDHPREARALLEAAVAQPVGAYDPPEERRMLARAKEILAQMR